MLSNKLKHLSLSLSLLVYPFLSLLPYLSISIPNSLILPLYPNISISFSPFLSISFSLFCSISLSLPLIKPYNVTKYCSLLPYPSISIPNSLHIFLILSLLPNIPISFFPFLSIPFSVFCFISLSLSLIKSTSIAITINTIRK